MMMTLIAAALVAAQPAAARLRSPAEGPDAVHGYEQMDHSGEHKGMDCCKDCCKDMAKEHEGTPKDRPAP